MGCGPFQNSPPPHPYPLPPAERERWGREFWNSWTRPKTQILIMLPSN